MSLDDIIKLNRNQSRQNKFSANRNINNNRQNGNRNNFQQKKRNNNQQRPRQQPQQQQQQRQVNNKPYGMLNRSKTIQKRAPNVRVLQTQQNNHQQQQRQLARINANQANRMPRNRRRRLTNGAAGTLPQRNQLNRFGGLASRIRFQNGQKNNANAPNNNNQRIRVSTQPQKVNVKSQGPAQQQPRNKRQQQLRQPRAALNNVRTKIAMQSARKNVMKAKRVLVNKIAKKGPIQQIMTQRYAKSMGLVQNAGAQLKRVNGTNGTGRVRKPLQKSKILSVNINNKVNKINRVKQQQRQKLQKTALLSRQQFKKPTFNRSRPQQQQKAKQSNAGRKVFF